MVDVKANVKNSQLATPLFEFSGACSGCGPAPSCKTCVTTFRRASNSSQCPGCSSIYSTLAPSTPYTTNDEGRGPTWANSLFEDNAEFGLGMLFANEQLRSRIERLMKSAIEEKCCSEELLGLFGEWIENKKNGDVTLELSQNKTAFAGNKM